MNQFFRVLVFFILSSLLTACIEDECENNKEPVLNYRFGYITKHEDHYHLPGQGSDYYCYQAKDSSTIINSIEILENRKKIDRNVSLCGNSYTYINIPLDLNSNAVTIIFDRDSKKDTLNLNYRLSFEEERGCGLVYNISYLKTESTLLDVDKLENLELRYNNETPVSVSDYNLYYYDYFFVLEQ